MYNSSYSQTKFGYEAKQPLHGSRGKSCGYYMRIIFFFSSLIQSLIIISLVLFLIYGQPEQSAEEKRVKELEVGFNKLSDNNIQLRKEKSELGAQLGARTAEKAAVEKELEKMKSDFNVTEVGLKQRIETCEKRNAVFMTRRPSSPIMQPLLIPNSEVKTLQSLNDQQKAMIGLIEANFTRTVLYMTQERDIAIRDRDKHHQEAIILRRENTMLQEQLTSYTRKCKEDFAHSLDGIKTVTRDFLNRITNLFPHSMTFHLTCDSQREQLEKIRSSCTNLSKDVENKFQVYLDKVGDKVAEIQAESSRLEVTNTHLTSDLALCEKVGKEAAADAAKQLQQKQTIHDNQVERLLLEQNRLRDDKKLLEERLVLKEKELQQQSEASQIKQNGLTPRAPSKWPSNAAPDLSKVPKVR
ncbi:hypothetical protein fugu_006511 [Takifugu bimaculatus]|uniref:Plasmalemma vesicle-associated protein n=1 Tax=Takifugu bimaculatus TaxID=433685 RepID=A0A4Z2BB54_9TELE|nr:hypothetical protein fugu_006511 [Takifugu bimaculatus]